MSYRFFKHMLFKCLILKYFILISTQIKCDLRTCYLNISSLENDETTKCVIKITTQFFHGRSIIYADNNKVHDTANSILNKLLQNFTVRFASGGNIHNLIPEAPNYIIIPIDNENLIQRLKQLKNMWDWSPRSKFIIVMAGLEFHELMLTVSNLWSALVSNFVILLQEENNILTLYHGSFYSNKSRCGTKPFIQKVGSCDEDLTNEIFIENIEDDFIYSCTFDILTNQCEPLVFDALNNTNSGIGVIFSKMLAQVTGFELNFPETRHLGVGGGAVVEFLKEKLINLRTFGYILCTTTLTDKLPIHFIRSYYLLSDSLIWVLPVPPAVAQWENVAFVFQWEAWGAIFFVLIMKAIFIWYFFGNVLQQSLFNVFLIQFQLILGTPTKFCPKTTTLRLLFILWLFSSLHLDSAFQGNLKSILTQPHRTPRISSVDELAKSSLKIYAPSYVYKLFDSGLKNQTIVSRSGHSKDDLKEVVRSGNLATVVAESTFNYYFQTTLDKYTGQPRFYKLKNKFLSFHLPMLFQKGHPLIDKFESNILLLHQCGIFKKLYFDSLSKYAINPRSRRTIISKPTPMSFSHLQIAFYVLILGFLISFITLTIEIIFYVEKNQLFRQQRI